MEVWQTSNLRRLRLGEEKKKKERKKEETTGSKYNGLPRSAMTRGTVFQWFFQHSGSRWELEMFTVVVLMDLSLPSIHRLVLRFSNPGLS